MVNVVRAYEVAKINKRTKEVEPGELHLSELAS
jgi:hypothetical protein